MTIRAVIVGCAHMHVNEVALYIHDEPSHLLVGVADLPADLPENTEKRYTRAWNKANVTEKYGAPVYEDYLAMLDEVKPDVAYVLCENAKKAAVAEEIARRGIDLILEKPMAIDSDSARKIVALKEKYGVNVFVNWPVAWRNYVHEMKAALDSGMCGTLQKMRYINGHTGPLGKGAKHRGVTENAEEMTDEERARIWWYRTECGGGAFLDILCYGCYYARWLFGKMPEDIMAISDNLNTPYGDVEDNLAALLRFDGGFAVAEGTWTTPRKRIPTGPELICSDGVIWCDGVSDGKSFVSAMTTGGEELTAPTLTENGDFKNMPCQYAAFKNEGKTVFETLSAEFNADVVAMIEAARRSSMSKKAEIPVQV